jgi:hypothetical protein
MRAWWAYWISVGFAAVLWIGAPLALGGDGFTSLLDHPLWLAIFVIPLVVGGVDLIAYRQTNAEVCRLEAQRHGWLRAMVGGGYSAGTFAWTGWALLVLAVLIIAAKIAGSF